MEEPEGPHDDPRLRAPGARGSGGKLTARVRQIAWCAQYLADIDSDLSVLHRIDDAEKLPGPRFYSLVYRLGAYQSVIAMRARQQKQDRKPVEMSIEQFMATHSEAMQEAVRRQGQEVDPGELQSS